MGIAMNHSPLAKLQTWWHEAVAIYGDDWPKAQGFVRAKLDGLNEDERVAVDAAARLMLLDPIQFKRQ